MKHINKNKLIIASITLVFSSCLCANQINSNVNDDDVLLDRLFTDILSDEFADEIINYLENTSKAENELEIVENETDYSYAPGCELPEATCCGSGEFFLFGDYLYLQTREEGLGFGYETRAGVINSPTFLLSIGQIGKEKTIKPGYNSGFRVGLGYLVPRYEWDIQVQWMHYHNNKRNSLPTIDPTINQMPPVVSLGTIISEDLLDKSGTLYAVEQKANAHWKLKYNTIDLELNRTFYPCDCFSLTPLIGIRGGWISQGFQVQYFKPVEFTQNTNFDVANPTIMVNADWHFHGYGLRGGLDVNWILGSGFNIYSNFSGSFLCSQLKLKHKERFGSGFLRTNLKEKVQTITPIFEVSLGLAWERYFSCDRFYFNIHAGWEEILWLDVNQTQRFSGMISPSVNTKSGIHSRRDRGNLGLAGLQAGLVFGF